MAEASRRRGGLWPTVLLGAGAAGLASYAGHHAWVTVKGGASAFSAQGPAAANLDSPATTALGLVGLAAWGVVLVTRGRVRRAVAALAGVAVLAAVPGSFLTRAHLLSGHDGSTGTVWPWVALAACLVGALAAVVAVRSASGWAEMGSRYDAPTGAAASSAAGHAPLEEQSNLDLWKSLDEGRDPTGDPD